MNEHRSRYRPSGTTGSSYCAALRPWFLAEASSLVNCLPSVTYGDGLRSRGVTAFRIEHKAPSNSSLGIGQFLVSAKAEANPRKFPDNFLKPPTQIG